MDKFTSNLSMIKTCLDVLKTHQNVVEIFFLEIRTIILTLTWARNVYVVIFLN